MTLSPPSLLPFHSKLHLPACSLPLTTRNAFSCLISALHRHLALPEWFLPDICLLYLCLLLLCLIPLPLSNLCLNVTQVVPLHCALLSSVALQIWRYLQIEGWGNSASSKPVGTISLTGCFKLHVSVLHPVILATFQAFSLAFVTVIWDH